MEITPFSDFVFEAKITRKNLSKELLKMIEKSKVELDNFIALANMEKFTQEELDDLGYMEDKIDIYEEDL